MDNIFEVRFEPSFFDVTSTNPKYDKPKICSSGPPPQEFHIHPGNPILPDIPIEITVENNASVIRTGVNLNVPHKVIVEIKGGDVKSFTWRKVMIPVAIGVVFTKSMSSSQGLSMSFSDRQGRLALKTIPVYPQAWENSWDLNGPNVNATDSDYQRPIIEENLYGRTDYWNMTYFTNLPKCSMNFEFWVTVRGVNSKRKSLEIEFYVDGQKITESNFDEMALRFPDLKKEDPLYPHELQFELTKEDEKIGMGTGL